MTGGTTTTDAGDPGERVAPDDGGSLFIPAVTGGARPDPRVLPASPTTRFAPAPTGDLHLGHLVNALYTWGLARATGGRVVLRIEDHDRQRSRPAFEAAMLDDLERLGLVPDEPSLDEFRAGRRRTGNRTRGPSTRPRSTACAMTGSCMRVSCSRATFAAYEAERGRPWRGIGCPGGCRALELPEDDGTGLRVAVGAGSERWVDLLAGPMADEPAATGDPLVRDRASNWTYAWCVVVDDLRHGIDLVIRGRDLLEATPVQLRLARLLGRETPPAFLHHPLVRRVSGQKLSKSAGDTAVRCAARFGFQPGSAVRDRRPPRRPAGGGDTDRSRRSRVVVHLSDDRQSGPWLISRAAAIWAAHSAARTPPVRST